VNTFIRHHHNFQGQANFPSSAVPALQRLALAGSRKPVACAGLAAYSEHIDTPLGLVSPPTAKEPAMTTRTNTLTTTAIRERATAIGLAAIVTLTLLAGMGRVANRQYEDAYVAQAAAPALMAAGKVAAPRA
jgi:hypothetical protein